MNRAPLAVLSVLVTTCVAAAAGVPLITEAKIPGATLRIEVQQPIADEKAAEIIEWLRSASSNVSLVYGRFPSPSPRVVVIPTGGRSWGGNSAVPFGRVTRNGEVKIEFFVNPDRPIREYYSDWTATHEFSHLMLPYVSSRHKWISEGFATYYQNILMARAGQYAEREAWQKLYDGFERGRLSRPELSPNQAAAAGIRAARMKIYWSGAAIALLADIELRERSGGRESLDVALDRLQRCCLPSKRSWSGPRLFAKLDALVDEPVFMPLYREFADTAGFPDMRPALRRLGMEIEGNIVRLLPDSELADLRIDITTDHPPP